MTSSAQNQLDNFDAIIIGAGVCGLYQLYRPAQGRALVRS